MACLGPVVGMLNASSSSPIKDKKSYDEGSA